MVGRYNLKDVAKLAGVGVGTASRVINNKEGVKSETREKVLKVIKELDYVPNTVARTLKQNSSKQIGVIISGRLNYFFTEVLEAIEIEASKNGYSIIIHYIESDDKKQDEFGFQYMLHRKIEGLIYLGGYFDKNVTEEIAKLKIPVVAGCTVIVEGAKKDVFSSVIVNNEESTYELIKYLLGKNHKNIGVIGSNINDYIYLERLKGYEKALNEYGISINLDIIENGYYTFEGGYNACLKILKKSEDISAIFATSDIMAIGAARALLEKGFDIPKDISLVGYDGLENSKYFFPSITTVLLPKRKIGQESVKTLIGQLNGDMNKMEHKIFETILIKRESVK